MQIRTSMIALAGLVALAACEDKAEEMPDASAEDEVPADDASPSPDSGETISILRPEFEQSDTPTLLEPLKVTVGFPDGGSELDAEAIAALEKVLSSAQNERGGPIVLGGHSDTDGSDSVNLRAGQARAEAVRDWLVKKGVAKDRIEMLSFGEQNPVEPNALPDGSANEAGRAANRRVEITVNLPAQSAP